MALSAKNIMYGWVCHRGLTFDRLGAVCRVYADPSVPFVAVVSLVPVFVELSFVAVVAVVADAVAVVVVVLVVVVVVIVVMLGAAVVVEDEGVEVAAVVATARRGEGAGTGTEGTNCCASLVGEDLEERRVGGECVVACVIRMECLALLSNGQGGKVRRDM